mmetsp:Transcript_4054/g.7174  ORF Transcript_4054/g.7174 Transcript_4054/m.7174 type:complete len:222 (+) Transcript_4054:106-771(+)
MVQTALLLPLLLNGAAAFVPMQSSSNSVQRYESATTTMNQLVPEASALDVVDEDGAATDPYDLYEPTSAQKTIATRDVAVGSGYTVGEDENQLLQIKFTTKFVEGKFTADIREFNVSSMVFKTGEQRCLPGLEQGLKGMKVGGVRKVRVPPNKGYGDNWYRGVVPPNSHLEFEAEVMAIAQSPGEEFMMKLEQFGVERAIGASVCFLYLAISPILEQKGYI